MEVVVAKGFWVFVAFLWAVGAGFVIFVGVVGLLVCVVFLAVAADFGPFPNSGVVETLGFAVFPLDDDVASVGVGFSCVE